MRVVKLEMRRRERTKHAGFQTSRVSQPAHKTLGP